MNAVGVDPAPPWQAELRALGQALRQRGWTLATAESCTGGLIAAACTAEAGASDWFDRGVVSYSNAAKTELLGVPAVLIERHGAVSQEVAVAMADGVLRLSSAQIAVAVTGIAGPGGGTPDKPVGTVCLALACAGRPTQARTLQLAGDRAAVRWETVHRAVGWLADSMAQG